MSIKIIIESDTPLKALSQCAALGLRRGKSDYSKRKPKAETSFGR